MTKIYSVAEAKSRLSALLREVERGSTVELTRRGKPVAIVLASSDYERLRGGARTFTQALKELRRKKGFQGVDLPPGFIEGLRDKAVGRPVKL
jgi:prevent-host-death family protein